MCTFACIPMLNRETILGCRRGGMLFLRAIGVVGREKQERDKGDKGLKRGKGMVFLGDSVALPGLWERSNMSVN